MSKHKSTKPRRWKQGEMKAYLAEQKTLEKGAINREAANKQQMFRDLWCKYIASIVRQSATSDLDSKAKQVKNFSPFLPVNPQYEQELRRLDLPLVVDGKSK
ncbi:hypothetical protein PYR66_10020 [Klebsiella aerogenes]|nr:hypothetical protein PYR66_10020 [Klebsiella aerogenes]